jgi:hypothetical protein
MDSKEAASHLYLLATRADGTYDRRELIRLRSVGGDARGATHSCSHSRLAGEYGKALITQCGTCFGCLLRRAAFNSSGFEDRTPYLDTTLTRSDLARFRSAWSDDLHAMAYATARGVEPADLLALQLPDGFNLDDARDLLTRGFGELETAIR